MKSFSNFFRKFLRDDSGMTATEYAIAGGLVGLLVIAAFTDLGQAIGSVIGQIVTAIGGP